jgi:hypothetical protein
MLTLLVAAAFLTTGMGQYPSECAFRITPRCRGPSPAPWTPSIAFVWQPWRTDEDAEEISKIIKCGRARCPWRPRSGGAAVKCRAIFALEARGRASSAGAPPSHQGPTTILAFSLSQPPRGAAMLSFTRRSKYKLGYALSKLHILSTSIFFIIYMHHPFETFLLCYNTNLTCILLLKKL